MENLPISDTDALFRNRQKFVAYNRFKLERILASFPEPTRRVLGILPRLLHVNHDKLPGYVAPEAPAGIHHLKLDQETKINLQRVFPDIALHRAGSIDPVIHSMILVGSLGTIGQNERSDLDFTLLVDRRCLSDKALEMLQTKLARIENWTWKEYGLETHFFVNDIAEVQKNIFGESDGESTGSAQAKLLKEEMYRTMTLFAGKAPFWWIVPVETDDASYQRLFHLVQSGRTPVKAEDFIDIGNVDEISPGEFFGGSIWTLTKSFHAPFKTLMKMALLEEYILHPSRFNLLCHDIKRKVQGGEPHDTIDPYLALFDRVQKYFSEAKSEDEIDALRIAFYLKSGTRVVPGVMGQVVKDPATERMTGLVQAWNWRTDTLDRLNNYFDWQMVEKVALGNRLHRILMACYKVISEKQQELDPGKNWISQRDTHLLGRKLFSYYSKAPYKVDNILAHVEGEAQEEQLTFLHLPAKGREKPAWKLIRGQVPNLKHAVAPEAVIRQAATLPFLIAFAAWNELFERRTRVFLRAQGASLREHDLSAILEELSARFARVDIASISNADLLGPERIRQLYLIVDFGLPPPRGVLSQHAPADAEERKAFLKEQLDHIKVLTAIRLTSWGELFCKGYTGRDCMGRMLASIKSQVDAKTLGQDEFLKVHVPSGEPAGLSLPWLEDHVLQSLAGPKAGPAAPPRKRA
ncbi:MAG: class I adenylate cyclase [Nitrospinaceae bacterium]|nr:MAG: class I adenylate cyclase [Nitrospinaceae bacterium]